jgi:large subunit ribosomal protein L5
MSNNIDTKPRLKILYEEKIVPEMMKIFNYTNKYEVPRLEKIVINCGLSEAKDNIKVIDIMSHDIAMITGQKPVVTRAKKSIAAFKLRKDMPIGIKVTLRGARMYEFLDRLINCAIPKIRDFRGLSPNSFDGHGNYNLGLREHFIFPEVDPSKTDKPRGLNITIATTAKTDKEAKELLTLFGFPFRKR